MRQLCVHRDISTTPRATLTHLSCSPNFPRASYLDERTLTYEPIVKFRLPFIQGTPDEKLINTIELKSFHVRQDRPQCFLVARQRLQVKAI